MSRDLLQVTESGLYCGEGDFWVDPWATVERAVVTHAHADHARPGSGRYLAAADGSRILRRRLGTEARIELVDWGERLRVGGVTVSLHPAGHILGSAQVRIERGGEVWVVTGDYKTEPDPTCAAFEPLRCDLLVTESTFGLPIYRWERQSRLFDQIDDWWRTNRAEGRASLLLAYALGKAQRLLAGIDASIGPIFTHGAVEKLTREYRESGVPLPPTTYVGDAPDGTDWSTALIVAPPAAHGTPWSRRFGALSAGFASGWMQIRGARRRRAVDRGFALSDHADWPGLLTTIEASGAERVWVTHGYRDPVVRYLRERGLDARSVDTRFEGELDDGTEASDVDESAR